MHLQESATSRRAFPSKSMKTSSLIALFATLCTAPPATAVARGRRAEVVWRALAHNPRTTRFSYLSVRFEVAIVDSSGRSRRVGPRIWQCAFSLEDSGLSCVWGQSSSYLRVRESRGRCSVEAQLSTEHGMGRTTVLARFPCTAGVSEWYEDAANARARVLVATR